MAEESNGGDQRALRLLLVEDEIISCKLFQEMLKKSELQNVDVIVANTMADALTNINTNTFDIIILDLNLPDSNGFDTLHKVMKECPHTAVIINSAIDDNEFCLSIIEEGAQDYLVKGKFDVRALSKSILYSIERKKTEEETKKLHHKLYQSQKLESIGTLAAGIAHEINTPIQFINDNTHFLSESFKGLLKIIGAYRELLKECDTGEKTSRAVTKAQEVETEVDLAYLEEEMPSAFEQTMDGLERVSTIVNAMKNFSHISGDREKSKADINKAIESTITISRNEWKYVANLNTEFDSNLPLVNCYLADINQVVMNLIVNASHAIGDVVRETSGEQGTITVATHNEGDSVIISISDSGTGIPEEVRGKIFDPFFTTKDVGKGTGQGLAMAYSTIVEKHGGNLTCETEVGKGTTFHITLPIEGAGEGSETEKQSE